METLIADDDGDGNESIVFTMDLREVTARVHALLDDSQPPRIIQQPQIILSDGHQRLELTGGNAGRSSGSIQGAQRLAVAAIDYAAGMALLELPHPEPPKADLP